MTGTDLHRRLDRIERTRAGRDTTTLPRVAVLYAAPGEDTAPRLADMIERGEHRRGWPVLTIRADWPVLRHPGARP
ncbi:hypothetical protein MKK75_03675 [Methylobacterium sp. J-030]|uniref:hypothetical protein n=1 Tax=Methylobacterium sp. J-030 TaxID=2836627 RepID=UPI001FBBE7DA|nr:hypothetical protein [Methylobacterium sp. J-030]MCJ2067917.1 hypothetical protein [Methylobacterium sp. J-030]